MVEIACPQCGNVGRSTNPVPAGSKVRCKQCGFAWEFHALDSRTVGTEVAPAARRAPAVAPPQPAPVAPPQVRAVSVPIPSPPPVAPVGTIACRFCAEPILPAAVKCKHCGEFLDVSSRPAPVVSPVAPVAAPPPPQFVIQQVNQGGNAQSVQSWRPRWRLVDMLIYGFLFFFFGCLLLGFLVSLSDSARRERLEAESRPAPVRPSPPIVRAGDEAIVGVPGAVRVFLATTEGSLDEMLAAERKGGPDALVALSEMVRAGKIVSEPNGVRVRVLDASGAGPRKVRVIDGEHRDAEGWIHAQFVRPAR